MKSPTTSPSEVKRRPRDDGYGRSSRFYEIPQEEGEDLVLPSVTTILQVIGKPALVNWAAKTERELVIETAAQLYEDIHGTPKMARPAYRASLEKRLGAEKAHQKLLQKAGEIGSAIHALIEWNIRKSLGQKVGPEPEVPAEGLHAFSAWERWRDEVQLEPRLIEQVVWSKRYGYAGTSDLVGTILHEGERVEVVLDWKSGKAIYPEAWLQIAAYTLALVEMGHLKPGAHGCIVRLPKVLTDPEFEAQVAQPEEVQDKFGTFLHVQQVWRWQEGQK